VATDDVYDLYQRGTELLNGGHNHQAVIPLARARDLEPDKTSIREALGRALFGAQRYEQAAAEFQAVVDRAPTNDFALFCLGRSLQLLGRHAEARRPLALRLSGIPRPGACSGRSGARRLTAGGA
jgi:Flp pilus assembly protein TadD